MKDTTFCAGLVIMGVSLGGLLYCAGVDGTFPFRGFAVSYLFIGTLALLMMIGEAE